MDKCPSCERKFEWLRDFPLIYVIGVERSEMPEAIAGGAYYGDYQERIEKGFWFWKKVVDNPELPEEVLRLSRETGKDHISYNERIYVLNRIPFGMGADFKIKNFWGVSDDITQVVRDAINNPVIDDTLSELESYIGKEIRIETLLSLPGFKERVKSGNYDDFQLSFGSEEKCENKLRKVKLTLDADIGAYDCHLGGSPIGISQDLAELTYEGRINQ